MIVRSVSASADRSEAGGCAWRSAHDRTRGTRKPHPGAVPRGLGDGGPDALGADRPRPLLRDDAGRDRGPVRPRHRGRAGARLRARDHRLQHQVRRDEHHARDADLLPGHRPLGGARRLAPPLGVDPRHLRRPRGLAVSHPRARSPPLGPLRLLRRLGLLSGRDVVRLEPLRGGQSRPARWPRAQPAARGREHAHAPAVALHRVRRADGAVRLRRRRARHREARRRLGGGHTEVDARRVVLPVPG